jgi:hypothetical protein
MKILDGAVKILLDETFIEMITLLNIYFYKKKNKNKKNKQKNNNKKN